VRFLVIADTHFVRPPAREADAWWNRTTERFSDVMGEALVRKARKLAPDFVVHCGDFTGWSTPENHEFGAGFMNRLGCPWHLVPGNHDTWEPPELGTETPFIREGIRSFRADLQGLRVLFLDTASWFDVDGVCAPLLNRERYIRGGIAGMGVSESDLAWLKRELAAGDLPMVLVAHAPVEHRETYPVVTLPRGEPAAGPTTEPSKFVKDMIGIETVRRLIRGSRSVIASFAGHWHLNDAVVRDGVLHVMTGALREYPYEVRLVEYDGVLLRVSTHGLDVPELRERSYVPEWGNRWIEGTEEVREFLFTVDGRSIRTVTNPPEEPQCVSSR
jgi:3',5'-cyclic AMP phosphodiesterase CpdA